MNKTKIAWVRNPDGTQGYTWNIVAGCLHGCDYCYARRIMKRFGKTLQERDFKPVFYSERLNDPLKLKKPSTIFVCSMGDLFGNWMPDALIEQILEVVRNHPQQIFLFLSKNPYHYRDFVFPGNCWLGYTGTNGLSGQFQALQKRPGSKNKRNFYMSAEPLLDYAYLEGSERWLIIGSLNQNGRPVSPEKGGTKKEWILAVLAQADQCEIPVFIKPELYQLYPDLPQRQELPYLNLAM